MESQQERRSDSVAIPGSAAKIIAAVATAFVISISGVLWTVVTDSIRNAERISLLERFGPGIGNRFTKEDGDRLETRLNSIEQSRNIHDNRAEQLIGKWEQTFKSIDRRLDQLERDCRECRK